MKRALPALVCVALLALSGCVITHELDASSKLPRGIARDPRLRGLGPVRIETASHDPDDGVVVATVTSLEGKGSFKVKGAIGGVDVPEGHPANRWTETYNDVQDTMEYVLPNCHYIKIVPSS